MDQRIYHGKITPNDIARNLITHFHRGNLQVQQIGTGRQISVQIATHERASTGGQTALGISIQALEDGVLVQVGKQAWLGVAASLGFTAIAALKNPLSLLKRIDALAQDIENIKLNNDVWRVIEQTARGFGAGHELSERLRRMICEYCTTPNPKGENRCIACGAPLGNVQPITCKKCGFVVTTNEAACPNCKSSLT